MGLNIEKIKELYGEEILEELKYESVLLIIFTIYIMHVNNHFDTHFLCFCALLLSICNIMSCKS